MSVFRKYGFLLAFGGCLAMLSSQVLAQPVETRAERSLAPVAVETAPADAGPMIGVPDAESQALAAQAKAGGSPGGAREKTLANGLYMSGTFTYTLSGSNATVTLAQINNDSFTRTTGTLRLELWATTSVPARGAGFTGYRLVNFSTLTPLAPRTFYSDIVRSGTYNRPPDGVYWLVLVLSEFDSVSCPAADGFCITDSFVSNSQVQWGNVQPTYNYTDLWYNSAEAGWGVSITHHTSNIIFAAWYTYDSLGIPYWYVVPACQLVGDSCTGTAYDTRGPAFGPTFNPNAVTVRQVGSVSFSFGGQSSGTMTYNINGQTGTKFISRQPF